MEQGNQPGPIGISDASFYLSRALPPRKIPPGCVGWQAGGIIVVCQYKDKLAQTLCVLSVSRTDAAIATRGNAARRNRKKLQIRAADSCAT